MTLPELTEKLAGFVWILADLLVCGFAARLYQDTRKRSLLLIAIACGIGAIAALLPWIQFLSTSWGYWYLFNIMHIVGAGLWLVGSWLLFKEYGEMIRLSAPSAPPPDDSPPPPFRDAGTPGDREP